VTLRAKKPKDSAYPAKLESLGNHIRQRRLDLGLRQRDVAHRIGVDESSILNWEREWSEPELRYLPAIIAFLGYVPDTSGGDSLGAVLVRHRTLRGLSQSAFARELRVDPGTLGRWERDERQPTGRYLELVRGRIRTP
jgi:transcriptional regulator with XRE-family HTH domain